MEIRRGKTEDMQSIIKIIRMSQEYFKSKNIPQWQGDYPNEDIINQDIENKSFYIVEDKGIKAFVAAVIGVEPTYEKIYDGSWITSEDSYITLHRVAVSTEEKGKGLGSEIFKFAEDLARENKLKSLRIDTHRKNESMIRLIEKNDFKYCGIVYMADGGERVAYEKLLKD